ncbi:renin receptor isoform X2 [Orussus abietinus]|uniref:renin receptor isoform X2 n=1 Tax=Orussus abietinus TaxID=222816 RepID=UPI0006257A1E|nr:renin receptor isoform X2 [Orussus abietinus]
MFDKALFVAFLLSTVRASGDFIVLHSPDSVQFTGNEEIDQSLLKELFTAALGYTVKQRGTWSGFSIINPFDLPVAVVGMAIEGVDSLESPTGMKFPLNVDEVEETTWQALSGRLEERDKNNTLVRIYLGDGVDALGQSALGELKPTAMDKSLKYLNLNNEEDRKFLEEVQLLHAIAKKVPSAIHVDSKPDVYWLVVSGLRPVLDLHGKDSPAVKEALSLLNNGLNDVCKAFMEVYDYKVLIAAFTNDASQVRHTRSVILERQIRDTTNSSSEPVSDDNDKNIGTTSEPEVPKETEHNKTRKLIKVEDLNLAKQYSPDYPIIFNILLWFGVAFFFSLLAICIAIASMDPGRDSIIYRMTSNRMKKDN